MFGQLMGALVLTVASVGLGLAMVGLLRRHLDLDPWTSAGLIPLLGVFGVGAVTLIAGHLSLLHPALPIALALTGVALPFLITAQVKSVASDVAGAMSLARRNYPVLVIIMLTALALAFVAGLAPPSRTDEIEYHWPAPLTWAENGSWNASPYRHVNAFPFMEIVYTSAALMNSYVAAHWLHTLTLVGLALCSAGLTLALGSRLTVPVAAAAVVSPVVWLQSFVAYNDVAAAAFSVAAVAALISGNYSKHAQGATCLLLVAAISIKPTSVAAVGVVALIALLAAWWQVGPNPPAVRRALQMWKPLVLTGLLTTAFWTVRQYAYTGNWLDPAMTVEPDEYAKTMLPDSTDRLLMPILPFISGIIGNAEPWGGRTPLVLQALLIPALIYAIVRGGEVLKRFASLAVPAYAHWMFLGVLIVRTRFHILSWTLLIVAIALVAEDLVGDRRRWRVGLRFLWLGLITLGLFDVLRATIQMIGTID